MSETFEVIPSQDLRVIDLVEKAGIDVSDWANFKGKNPATNPKYCYEWAFIANDRVVLNLWYEDIVSHDGRWIQDLSPRAWGRDANGVPLRTNWILRADKFEKAINIANQNRLPIRVIVCAGKRRKNGDASATSSQVKMRILDPVSWAVTSYTPTTGACVITRGVEPDAFADQFSNEETNLPDKYTVTSEQFNRDPEIRRQARIRANGKCEFCGATGFLMENGKIYIETHHVVPLFEGGLDIIRNVAALCPNHHKEAHFSENKTKIREHLLAYLDRINAK